MWNVKSRIQALGFWYLIRGVAFLILSASFDSNAYIMSKMTSLCFCFNSTKVSKTFLKLFRFIASPENSSDKTLIKDDSK